MTHTKGFTLIEIMTSVAVFAVVMVISMGSILSVLQANRKSESLKTVMDNLNLSVESMSREMRFGMNYNGGLVGDIYSPHNCSDGCDTVAFLANDRRTEIVYRSLSGSGKIEKSTDAGTTYVPVTAPEITIEDLKFYVLGALPSAQESTPLQPKILIKIKGSAGTKASEKTNFTVETLVSQRVLDNQ
ncbi:prepilin-type N-terminal cleavage/methylation domain-containing protein [Candidatus Parcubacteria bacterium]|nr:prepilin-type N-terminal cleavage/methylation domain-containing protein [Candidatus Parcubacteria bacterium]